MARRASSVLTVLALAAALGCAGRPRLRIFPPCADGLPPKILTDPGCPPDSICGYSCLPGRWAPADEAIVARGDSRRDGARSPRHGARRRPR